MGGWHTVSLSFANDFPDGVSAIGIRLSTGGDVSDWTTTELYVDTVEIR